MSEIIKTMWLRLWWALGQFAYQKLGNFLRRKWSSRFRPPEQKHNLPPEIRISKLQAQLTGTRADLAVLLPFAAPAMNEKTHLYTCRVCLCTGRFPADIVHNGPCSYFKSAQRLGAYTRGRQIIEVA